MLKLLHFPLDPFCRSVRLQLAELGQEIELVEERPWLHSSELQNLNPAGELPVLTADGDLVVAGISAVVGHIEENLAGDRPSMLGADTASRAETRRLMSWFDHKFHREVGSPVLREKVVRRFLPRESGGGAPDMGRVRQALQLLREHLDYIGDLAEQRNWLAGDALSLADLTAAAHISCIDYLGDVPWRESETAKQWYQRVKSRPSFRTLLSDRLRGLPPPRIYAELDF